MNVYFFDNRFMIELVDAMGDDMTPAHIARVSRESYDKETVENNKQLIRNLLMWNHMSPFEHIVITYRITGVPLFVAEQLLRYRTASVLKKSYRYCKVSGSIRENFYIPKEVEEKFGEDAVALLNKIMWFYNTLIEDGIPPEKARFILPTGLRTDFFYTIDMRNLFHIFEERISPHAQEETREVVKTMFKLAYPLFTEVMTAWVEIKGSQYIKEFFKNEVLEGSRSLEDIIKRMKELEDK